ESAAYVPPEIVLQNHVAEAEVIESWLREKRGGHKVAINVPSRGRGKKLVDLVAQNAAEVLAQMRARWLADERRTPAPLHQRPARCERVSPPPRGESYDISNRQGTPWVGSMIVFENGQPATSQYRRFQIKSVEGADDFASLQEVLRRRFGRAGQAESTDNVAK